jgi:hypothetical protein
LENVCINAEQFAFGLSALCDIFRSFRVPDELFKPESIPADQTLKRLTLTLEKELNPAPTAVLSSVEMLQAVNEWRTATQHSTTKANRAAAERSLGIRYYPNVSWQTVWDELRSKIVEALNTISAELR